MRFSYNEYRSVNYIVPTIFLIVAFAAAIFLIKTIVQGFVSREEIGPNMLSILTGCTVSLVFFYISLNPLIHGGFALRNEFEQSAVYKVGTIEKIVVLNSSSGQKYIYNGKTSFGVRITIDGSQYTLMDIGSFDEGDRVAAYILPKSKFILSIDYA